MATAEELFAAAFDCARDPRSEPYKAGCLAALRRMTGQVDHIACPWRMGTVEADAWHAGADEGRLRWRLAEQ